MGELARIKRNGLCHGCGACATAVGGDKIKMSMTSAGYLRPEEQQPLATADEEIVQKVCSGAELQHLPSTEVSYDRSWGLSFRSRPDFPPTRTFAILVLLVV